MANSLWELFVRISGDNSSFKKSVKDSQADMSSFERTALATADKLGDAFASLGLKFSAIGLGALILKTGEDFQKAQATIGRATGDTGKSLDALGESFKHLYASSGRSAEEIAGALAKVRVETKLQGGELEALTAANLKFAKVAGSDVSAAVDQTQVLFQNWGVSTANQAEALDVLYATMTTAGMGVSELASQMTELGPTARAFGLSFTQTAALVGSFDDAGMKASDMVRGLNSLFTDFAKKGKDPAQALTELVEHLRKTKTEGEAVNYLLEQGFAKKSAVAFADAARRGAFDFANFVKTISDSKGKVDEVARSTKTFGENWAELQHQLALAAEPTGNFIVKWASDSISKLNQMSAVMSLIVKQAAKQAAVALTTGVMPSALVGASTAPPAASGPGLNSATAGAGGASGGGLMDLSEAFKTLGLKDLNKELAESIRAFQALAASGKATHDQMLQAAGAIQKIRDQIKGVRENIDLVKVVPSGPSLDDLRALPIVVHEDDVQNLIQYDRNLQLLNDTLAASVTAATLAQRNVDAVADAFHGLGLNTPAELEEIATAAQDDYKLIRESGVASADAIGQAWAKMFKAQLDAQLATGKITRAEYDDLVRQTDVAFGKMGQSGQRMTRTLGQEFEQMTRRMFDNLERGIAHSIVEWKGWGDTFKSLAKSVAEDTLEILLKGLFAPLEKKIAGILGSLGGGASTAAGGASSAAGSAGGIGGAASAVGGVAGAVNMVSGVVSAVSSVVGNFQMAGMNKSLDVLVNHTLVAANELMNLRRDEWDRESHLMLKLDDMWNEIRNVVSAVKSGGSGGGRGGITFNSCSFNGTPQQNAAAILQYAELAGAI